MQIDIEGNFSLLFDKNNNMAYKALQTLQKECEESDKVYPELPVFFSLNFKNADKHWIYWDIEPNNLSENYAQFYNCFFRSIPVFLRNSPH